MQMTQKVVLAAGAMTAMTMLAACSDSSTAPQTPSPMVGKPSFVVAGGTVTNNTPEVGKVKICKTGNIGGSFDVTRAAVGSPDIGTVSGLNTQIAAGTCVLVAEDNSPANVGSNVFISEDAAANVVSTVTGCVFIGGEPPVIDVVQCELAPVSRFINHFHGYVITVNNTYTPPPSAGCTFTQGYYKNHENVVAQLLSTNGGYVVNNRLVVSQNGVISYTAAQIDAIYGTPPKGGNAEIILLHQLITAELNIKGGASVPAPVLAAINAARLLMNGGITAAEEDDAKALAEILDAYNNGITGPGHCDD